MPSYSVSLIINLDLIGIDHAARLSSRSGLQLLVTIEAIHLTMLALT
jgi:hypothetical protein